MPKRTKRRKLKARVSALEKKVTQLDKEMHPSAKELTDALWDTIQYMKANPLPLPSKYHTGAKVQEKCITSDVEKSENNVQHQ